MATLYPNHFLNFPVEGKHLIMMSMTWTLLQYIGLYFFLEEYSSFLLIF